MKNWQRYPEYKDSGVEWLGEIPKHWEVKKLKFLITEPLKYGANESAELNDKDCPRFIRITDIAEDGSLREETFRSLPHDLAKPFILKTGDILFARSGATVGKTFMYREHWGIACYAGYLIRARLKISKAIPEFISYFANSSIYWDWISSIFIQATIQNVSAEKYANLSLPVPPLTEQKSIAHFLDRETSKLDKLIAKKQRFIELLQEKRTALISHAVTKGLNPDIPMKDSGISWLGQIPKHWEVMKLKYIVPDITVGIVVTPAKYYVNSGIPCLRSLNISSGLIKNNDLVFISPESNELHSKSKIYTDDIVIVRTGIAGTAAIVTPEYNETNCIDLLIIRKSIKILSKYLYYYLGTHTTAYQVKSYSVGAIQAHYNTSTLAQLFIVYPELEEQKAIAHFLDQETAKIDTLIEKTKTSIEKLKEYRTALISAAVTGKIDIREEI